MILSLNNLFLNFLTGEAEVISAIVSFPGELRVEKGCLVFSLAGLFEFLKTQSQEAINYADFQRQLYQSTLNQDLKAHGAQVVVHRSTGKVETNLYRLERIEPVDSNG